MTLTINSRSLKFRMTVVVVLLVLFASGLVALATLTMAERKMSSVVGDQQFALLSSAAAYIDQDLDSKKTLLKSLSERMPLDVYASPAALQDLIESHATLREEFYNVVVFDPAGNMVANLNDRRQVGKQSFAGRAYLLDTIKAREGVVSAPFKSVLSGLPVVLITEPVFDASGRLMYVLGGALDLQRPSFFGQIEALHPGKTGYLFMLTRDGTLIQHPDRSRLLHRVTQEPGGAIPATLAAMGGFEGWTAGRTKAGVPAIIAFKPLRQADWIIGAVYPEHEAFAPLIAMRGSAVAASVLVAVVSGLLGWLTILRLLRPLGALLGHLKRIADGGGSIRVFDVARRDEFGELSRAFYALSQQRQLAEAHLALVARTDPLTGISNRRKFEEVFEAALGRVSRVGRLLALAYLDIDHFKAINDSYGHGVGDQVLVEFAARLTRVVRATDTVARLAGDEFVVIFDNLADDTEPAALGQKILDSMRPPFLCGEHALTVTTSVGIALTTTADATLDNFLKTADEALYLAKHAGRNAYAVKLITTA
jgi:diguanylate cyclase (GGDEF)-like protein